MAGHKDAMLMMQILQWGEASGATDVTMRLLQEARGGAPPRSADDPDVVKCLILHETIGTFCKQGVLDRGLVDDLLAIGMVWSVVGPAALAQREQMGVPELWENFEALATG